MLLQVMAGPDGSDPTAIQEPPPEFSAQLRAGAKGLRLGFSPDLGCLPVDPEVRASCERAALLFEELGASVEEVQVDMEVERMKDTFATIWLSDYAASYGDLAATRGGEMTPWLREMVEEAARWPASRLAGALHDLEWHRFKMDALVRRYDLLLTPTLAVTAFPIGQRPAVIDGRAVDPDWGFTPFTYPFNMSGHPAASVPCGFSSQWMPIGLHIVGHRGGEATVLRASAAYEEARPWADKRPPLA